ncbi:CAP-associated domain-containing protein [Paenibacillus ginsengarvi]|uniref:Copper amine oxidase n=1 Tax=Paenibacillus ginsengarvi TaxID=400777 RepID=A0A3B0CEZ1_9BACL|nr:CAP-associated domain-containing protein [Paenibacillus ginsengarvi]RKN82257.1 copper amine oxidase [Paenibacillus ginsengarvi]
MKKRYGWNHIGKWSITALLTPALLISSSFVSSAAEFSNAAQPAVSVAAAAQPAAGAFKDTAGHWGSEAIGWALAQGIVDGFADGTFQPDRTVSEAEFVTMLLRAFTGKAIAPTGASAPWYTGYYAYANELRLPVDSGQANVPYARGQVARLIAAAGGQSLNVPNAIRYLLDNGLAQGKTAATVEGFGASDTVTRAEAVQLVRNVLGKKLQLTGLPASARAFTVRGISLGDSLKDVRAKLGEPARQDPSEYGFDWYIYNQDYANYAQIGIKDGKVVGLYTSSAAWTSDKPGIGEGQTSQDIVKALGKPLDSITKGFTLYILNNPGEKDGVYEIDDSYVTFYYDTHENNTVEAIQLIAKEVEEAKPDYYGSPSDALRTAFEREVFDLANAARAKRGLKPFQWDDAMAVIAYGHSEDMAKNGYFDHKSPKGDTLKQRFEQNGVAYRTGAENIAAGQPNAIVAHSGWLNSHTGHRESLLGATTRLGVGVYFGGSMHVYFTQNFYTPLKE